VLSISGKFEGGLQGKNSKAGGALSSTERVDPREGGEERSRESSKEYSNLEDAGL